MTKFVGAWTRQIGDRQLWRQRQRQRQRETETEIEQLNGSKEGIEKETRGPQCRNRPMVLLGPFGSFWVLWLFCSLERFFHQLPHPGASGAFRGIWGIWGISWHLGHMGYPGRLGLLGASRAFRFIWGNIGRFKVLGGTTG